MSRQSERALRLSTWKQRVAHVFDVTERFLKANAEAIRAEPYTSAYGGTAYLLLRGLISKEVAERYGAPNGLMSGKMGTWITTIGETLFEMRNSPSLAEFCDRIASREDVRAAFYEAFVARMFLDFKYYIWAIGETGKKGEDFDFMALGPGGFICAEVTCLKPHEFNEATVRNALKHKIDQLLPNQINAVFIVLPEGRFSAPKAEARLKREVIRIFNVSRRVNLVYFLSEKHDKVYLPTGEVDMLQYQVFPVFHARPRNPCPALQFFLVFGHGGKDMSLDPAVTNVSEDKELGRLMNNRPYYQWIDRLIGRAP